jgi:hypothetical protein
VGSGGQSELAGLHIALDELKLSHHPPHRTTQHLFVIPTATYAVKLLLMMGKERPKHVEFPE